LPFAAYWGEGVTSSSDGQHFRAGGHGQAAGYRNAKYGNEPGVLFYTHISDQYAPFHTKVINSLVRDATHVVASRYIWVPVEVFISVSNRMKLGT